MVGEGGGGGGGGGGGYGNNYKGYVYTCYHLATHILLISCSDTVGRCGMFCAIVTAIERCKTEGVVDVFQVVKALRVQKPGAIPTVVSDYIN